MDHYTKIRDLGRGAYGAVYLARNKKTKEQVAIKEIHSASFLSDAFERAQQEMQLLKSLNHPNIIGYRDSFIENNTYNIVMEYIDGGDLQQLIAKREDHLFTESEILSIFIQLVIALQYIHKNNIIHRDIKPQNIFLTRVGVVKLGDFGISRALDNSQDLASTQIGTPFYLSPEIWTNAQYNSKTDIWSLGCVLYELCNLKRPFNARDRNQLFIAVINGHYEPIDSKFSKELSNLIDSMLQQNPEDRPSADQILLLPFIREHEIIMISDNQLQLQTVNIIPMPKKRVRRVKKGRKMKKQKSIPEDIEPDMELPLPDVDLPKWAQKATDFNKSDSIEIADDEINEEDMNEWDDLEDATSALHDSLRRSLGEIPKFHSGFLPGHHTNIQEQITQLTDEIIAQYGKHIYKMLLGSLKDETREASQEFIRLMEKQDKNSVEKGRKILRLSKFNPSATFS